MLFGVIRLSAKRHSRQSLPDVRLASLRFRENERLRCFSGSPSVRAQPLNERSRHTVKRKGAHAGPSVPQNGSAYFRRCADRRSPRPEAAVLADDGTI